jgi:hypothetical protein
MPGLRLTDQADFGVIFDAVSWRLKEEQWRKVTAGGVVTKEIFVAFCIAQKYPSLGFECDGKPIGGIMFDGNAAHIEVLPEYHGRWGILWRSAIKWVFALKDPILVQVPIENQKCHRFMARNNWPRVNEDEKFVTYQMSSRAEPHCPKRFRARSATDVLPRDTHQCDQADGLGTDGQRRDASLLARTRPIY